MNPNTSVAKIGLNSLHWFLRYSAHTVFGSTLPAVTLTFWPQNLISTSINPNTSLAKIGWNSLHWFLRYSVHKVFRTYQLTGGPTRKHNVSDTEGSWWWRQITQQLSTEWLPQSSNVSVQLRQTFLDLPLIFAAWNWPLKFLMLNLLPRTQSTQWRPHTNKQVPSITSIVTPLWFFL